VQEKLKQMMLNAEERIKNSGGLKELEELRVSYLGKKGELTAILKSMGSLSPEERPSVGKLANDARDFIESKLNEAADALNRILRTKKLGEENIDVTMPGTARALGGKHPMTIVIDEIKSIFIGMGYEIADGPDVETDYYNFEALNIPEGHPAKDEQDTFYVEGGFVLRTQTSSVQIRTMERMKPPIRIIAPGRTYRSDSVDATHSPVFHQVEGLVVDRGVTMGDLKGALGIFARELFGEKTEVRFRPHHFPFTEPSAEMDISCFVCAGAGCKVCKESGYIELLGCGMVHPRVLSRLGIDSSEYSGFAFGMGLERVALARYNIPDLRLLFENDVRFLKQF